MLRECIEGVTVGAVEDDACGTRPCLQVFPCFVDIGADCRLGTQVDLGEVNNVHLESISVALLGSSAAD